MENSEIFRRFELLQNGRGVWESHWEEIAERVLPRSAEFTGEREQGDKRTEKLYDATAALALERFAAAVESLLTPIVFTSVFTQSQLRRTDPRILYEPGRIWHGLHVC